MDNLSTTHLYLFIYLIFQRAVTFLQDVTGYLLGVCKTVLQVAEYLKKKKKKSKEKKDRATGCNEE